ncbi:hypothetical protein BCR37DRAFT_398596 [Protomyces lactucae-debilis]|uniref:Myb-like domain-containing protein n=1 Tax=Protomyces lactucae-debilis TaxID=2754530 RepID=A0A1Y2FIJ1_PROLT|nr:uncharacterized protein BCR37DRAFT_398596 [Protomyces lactucae-debilis]ORY82635.1 hypothetical protein BCR37DRAFT_398596 [Protomyces lactucae-debilis]
MQPEGGFPSKSLDAQRDIWQTLPRPDHFLQSMSPPRQPAQVSQIQEAARLPSLTGIHYQPRQTETFQYGLQEAPRSIAEMPRFSVTESYPHPRPIFVQQSNSYSSAGPSPQTSPDHLTSFGKAAQLQPPQAQTQSGAQSPYSPHGVDSSISPALRPWDVQQRRPLSEPPFRPFESMPRTGYESSALPSPITSVRSLNRPGESMSRNSSFQGFNETPILPQTQTSMQPHPMQPYQNSRKRRSDSSEDEGDDGGSLVKWKQTHLDTLVRMKNEGSKWSDIASTLNNGKSANACRKMYAKVIKDRDVWTPELDQALKTLYRQKREAFWSDIGHELNTNWHEVEARVIALGLGAVRHH